MEHKTDSKASETRAIALGLLAEFKGDADKAATYLRTLQAEKTKLTKKPVVASDAPVIVQMKAVEKTYKLGRQHVQALNGIDLHVAEGEFLAITGSSGSGKSTLLQLIGGLDRPTAGEVTVDGHDLRSLSDRKLSVFRGQTIGFVFQFFYLQPFLRLQANLEVPGMFARLNKQERATRAEELATAVGLADRLRHYPRELSGGQMQRAAIARALLNRPKLLLADEPTGNLDSTNSAAIITVFEEIRQRYGTTVIIVTHDTAIAARADREIAMKDGRITS